MIRPYSGVMTRARAGTKGVPREERESQILDLLGKASRNKEIAIALRLPASNNVKFIRSPKEFLEDLQLRASKTNRIVATGRPQRPIPSTQPHTKTETVRAAD